MTNNKRNEPGNPEHNWHYNPWKPPKTSLCKRDFGKTSLTATILKAKTRSSCTRSLSIVNRTFSQSLPSLCTLITTTRLFLSWFMGNCSSSEWLRNRFCVDFRHSISLLSRPRHEQDHKSNLASLCCSGFLKNEIGGNSIWFDIINF